eukprot:TRINITY_DN3333_c0_g1_i1.p1 TRINITY_DN3333_c0_g1~~TRINITY_DN3333_c0_g1_i1.p1  ORF type:complete len:248 (+),score=-9.61 TRINITY_DN3333_c0_g1_i1:137-880(+)
MTDPTKPVVTGYPAAHPNSHPPAQTIQSTGTAYPYPAPPPAPYYQTPHYPPYYAQPSPYSNFLRRLIFAAIVVFLLIGTVTFILWLVLRPHVPEFSIKSASVSSFNLSSSELAANWNIEISAVNPNKKLGISYDNVDASVLYGSDALARTMLPPFYQGKMNATTVTARLAVVSSYVQDEQARRLVSERNTGSVGFNVRLRSWVRFRSGAWRTRRHPMTVYCKNVKIGISTAGNGTLVGITKGCQVDM